VLIYKNRENSTVYLAMYSLSCTGPETQTTGTVNPISAISIGYQTGIKVDLTSQLFTNHRR